MENLDLESEQYLQNLIMTKNVRVEDGRLLLLGRPGVMLNADFLQSMIKSLSDFNRDYVIEIGKRVGEEISKDYIARFNDTGKLLEFFTRIAPLSGIGRVNIYMEKTQVITTIHPSTLAEAQLNLFGLSDKPTCYLAVGLINEFFRLALKRDMKTEEVECVSKGDKMCKLVSTYI